MKKRSLRRNTDDLATWVAVKRKDVLVGLPISEIPSCPEPRQTRSAFKPRNGILYSIICSTSNSAHLSRIFCLVEGRVSVESRRQEPMTLETPAEGNPVFGSAASCSNPRYFIQMLWFWTCLARIFPAMDPSVRFLPSITWYLRIQRWCSKAQNNANLCSVGPLLGAPLQAEHLLSSCSLGLEARLARPTPYTEQLSPVFYQQGKQGSESTTCK